MQSHGAQAGGWRGVGQGFVLLHQNQQLNHFSPPPLLPTPRQGQRAPEPRNRAETGHHPGPGTQDPGTADPDGRRGPHTTGAIPPPSPGRSDLLPRRGSGTGADGRGASRTVSQAPVTLGGKQPEQSLLRARNSGTGA